MLSIANYNWTRTELKDFGFNPSRLQLALFLDLFLVFLDEEIKTKKSSHRKMGK